METRTLNIFSDGSIKTPESRPRLWLVLPDNQIPGGFPRNPANAPQVHYLDHYSTLTPEWQFFWYGLNKPSGFTEAYLKQQFHNYTRDTAFITDYHGSETSADYVNGTNLNKEPMKIKCLFCGRNVVTGESDGVYLYPKYINALAAVPAGMTYQTHPWLIHHATIFSNGKTNPFTNFGGRNRGIPVYYPFMGQLGRLVRYPLAWLRELGENEPIPNVYNPPM